MTLDQWAQINSFKIGQEVSREYLSEICGQELPLNETLEFSSFSPPSWKKQGSVNPDEPLPVHKIRFKLVDRPLEIYERIA